jgi:anaerobic magnesium-protoporphyrin IX monomethyl ester cyclase
MKKDMVVFVTITDYDNLGIGYMSAVLEKSGYNTKIIDFRRKRSDLLKSLKKTDPLIIGFSIIFLNHIDQFTDLIKYLRYNGIVCHFTAGGHYASLRHEELFQIIPQLDSIIRFEGEYPMLELVKCISNNLEWKRIPGLAFKEDDKIITNPVWPPENDLDKFPYPTRSSLKEYAFGKKFTVILAGRGCTHNCSFCNTRIFYHQARGPVKRIRKPESVAGEMNFLFKEKGCSVFIFHDDDFPVKSSGSQNWVMKFCNELERTGLSKKIMWKINCRTDDIEEQSFSLMKKNGLFLVFLGLEDGTNKGLKRLNKQLDVNDNIRGLNILKKLNIGFDYGFMLFQPSTTFITLNENLDFLRLVCGDGYTPVTFLRLIPLYETQAEKELRDAGRLIRTNGTEDYKFSEEAMNMYYSYAMSCISEWQNSPDGLEITAKWARNYCLVYQHYYDVDPEGIKICNRIKKIISDSNIFLLDFMKDLAEVFESGSDKYSEQMLIDFNEKIEVNHNYFRKEIINTMAELVTLEEALTGPH